DRLTHEGILLRLSIYERAGCFTDHIVRGRHRAREKNCWGNAETSSRKITKSWDFERTGEVSFLASVIREIF
ncbi:hypothetical protein, partial [Pseudomonas aeruginosa]|uniref:hypothetical protein n=1 Tax=Pseudomonas aeruginosa TaxID=287 RepID=UPI0019693B03